MCEKSAVGVNLDAKASIGWDTSEIERTGITMSELTWDTSEIERTGGPGRTEYTTYTYRAYCSTQDNRAYTTGK